ncbi:hypothetical protein AAFC00_000065 [Neodothiora populina]|uniref:UBC core domain-containing protein n=1 Tax=Neodothiora populina TaxID=2781224 RepID=A0ABR3P197_9PEZI
MSLKGPTVKRILKEAAELSQNPSPDYHAAPLDDSDLYTWHFTIRGPPAPSPLATGIYHGQITLPPSYPLKPPNFRFLTPSGRFEPNREICLSISGHHEESWQPAWGIRTALVAIRAFMDSDAGGQVGGMSAADSVKRKLAGESKGWKCRACGSQSNEEILRKHEEEVREILGAESEEREAKRREEEEKLAKEMGFAAKSPQQQQDKDSEVVGDPEIGSLASGTSRDKPASAVAQAAVPTTTTTSTPVTQPPSPPASLSMQQQQQQQQRAIRQQQAQAPAARHSHDVWLDRAIIGIVVAIVVMLIRRFH